MLYNLGIAIYGALISVASLWNEKAKKWKQGRKNWTQQLPDIPKNRSVIWFHCASMGEYDQGLPVMEKLKQKDPSVYLLVTFFSPSGYEFLKNKSIGDHTCYLPLDTPRNAKQFVHHFQPNKVFFVKYEFWLNYIDACRQYNATLYGLSTVFQSKQRFFQWYGGRFKGMINKFEHFFVQNEASGAVLEQNGHDHFTVTGDTRYDRVLNRAQADHQNELLAQFSERNKAILVVGSSWPKDEAIVLPVINSRTFKPAVILAPHEVHEEHIQSITNALEVPFQLYTDLEKGEALDEHTKVIILNCIGVLANAYKYGSLAYVGGAFRTGLHNILEPAAFGLPVIFGPNYEKFPEASTFIQKGIGSSISTQDEFQTAAINFLEKPSIIQEVKAFINTQQGASEKVIQHVLN